MTPPSALAKLEALEELCEKATPGPWKAFDVEGTLLRDHGERGEEYWGRGNTLADGRFIAASRTALPILAEFLREMLSKHREAIDTDCLECRKEWPCSTFQAAEKALEALP